MNTEKESRRRKPGTICVLKEIGHKYESKASKFTQGMYDRISGQISADGLYSIQDGIGSYTKDFLKGFAKGVPSTVILAHIVPTAVRQSHEDLEYPGFIGADSKSEEGGAYFGLIAGSLIISLEAVAYAAGFNEPTMLLFGANGASLAYELERSALGRGKRSYNEAYDICLRRTEL